MTFVSRSAMDEICQMLSDNPNLKTANMADPVATMYEVVLSGRGKKRVLQSEPSSIKTFDNMKELSAFMRNHV